MSKIEITNAELFNSKKVEVETCALFVGDNEASGDAQIYFIDEEGEEQVIEAFGQFGLKDYEPEFGFVFKA